MIEMKVKADAFDPNQQVCELLRKVSVEMQSTRSTSCVLRCAFDGGFVTQFRLTLMVPEVLTLMVPEEQGAPRP